MRIWIALGMLSLLPLAAQAGGWSDLWHRPDQLGEKALESGDPQKAASLYSDPRRQAYAQLKAGQYTEAAQRLAPFSDAESQYNRGNALARGGELKPALDAYEAALKHADLDPALRRDAEHNRDLVAQQLQADNKPQPGGKAGQPSAPQPSAADEQAGSGGNSSDASPTSNDSSNTAGASHRPDSSQSSSAQGTTSATRPQRASQGNSAGGAERAPSSKGEAARSAPGSGADPGAGQAGSAPEDDAGSAASRTASAPSTASAVPNESADTNGSAAGNQSDEAKGSAAGNQSDEAKGSAAANGVPTTRTEQQLALEQWLRQIPDDPGGLLRRKFLIEHLRNQQVQP